MRRCVAIKGIRLKVVVVIAVILVILWAFSPLIIPQNYANLYEKEKQAVETAIENAFKHLDSGIYLLTIRIELIEIVKNTPFKHPMLKGKPWEIRLRGYTFFYIPTCEIRVYVDSETMQALCGSIRSPGYKWS